MSGSSPGRLVLALAGIGLALLGLVIWLGAVFDLEDQVVPLLQWIEAQGLLAPLIFVAIMVLVTMLIVPGYVFTIGAGFLFGVVEGTAYVVVGTTIGAMLAFLVARHVFGERAQRALRTRAKLDLLGRELAASGWRIVLLTRLIPLFPGKLSNYAFGLVRMSFRGYSAGTFVGLIPFSLHNAYLGSLAGDIATEGLHSGLDSSVDWAAYGAGFIATLVTTVYIAYRARRALAGYTARDEGAERPCRG